jgi:hypothetical protein
VARRNYTDDQREAALAALLANGGNLTKTEVQTGISRSTLREWRDGIAGQSSAIATLKKEYADSYRDKLKRAREVGLDRMLELIPKEFDLHKVTGAVKVLSELNITEKVVDEYSRSEADVSAADGAANNQGDPATSSSLN